MARPYGRIPTKGHYKDVNVKHTDGSDISSLISGYELTDYDVSGSPIYIGKTDKNGGWVIVAINTNTGATRYVKGASGYSTGWDNRASQTYDYFSEVF